MDLLTRLENQSNNVFITIEREERVNIFTGTGYATSHKIVVSDDSDDVIVKTVKTFEDVRAFFSTNSYRDVLLMANREGENLDKYLGIAEVCGGFYFCCIPYSIDDLDTYYLNFGA